MIERGSNDRKKKQKKKRRKKREGAAVRKRMWPACFQRQKRTSEGQPAERSAGRHEGNVSLNQVRPSKSALKVVII